MAAVDDRLQGTQRALLALAHSPAAATGQHQRLQADALLLQKAEQFDGVMLVDAGGTQVMNSAVPYGAPLPVQALPPVLEVLQEGAPIVMDLFRLPPTGRFLTGSACPFRPAAGVRRPVARAPSRPPSRRPPCTMSCCGRSCRPTGSRRCWTAPVRSSRAATNRERFVGTRARAAWLARIAGGAVRTPWNGTTVGRRAGVTAIQRSRAPAGRSGSGSARRTGGPGPGAIALLMVAAPSVWWPPGPRLGARHRLHDAGRALGARCGQRPSGPGEAAGPPCSRRRCAGRVVRACTPAVEDAHARSRAARPRMRTILDTATDAIVNGRRERRPPSVLFNRAARCGCSVSRTEARGPRSASRWNCSSAGPFAACAREAAASDRVDGGSREDGPADRLVEGLAGGRTAHLPRAGLGFRVAGRRSKAASKHGQSCAPRWRRHHRARPSDAAGIRTPPAAGAAPLRRTRVASGRPGPGSGHRRWASGLRLAPSATRRGSRLNACAPVPAAARCPLSSCASSGIAAHQPLAGRQVGHTAVRGAFGRRGGARARPPIAGSGRVGPPTTCSSEAKPLGRASPRLWTTLRAAGTRHRHRRLCATQAFGAVVQCLADAARRVFIPSPGPR
jgi:hypothetical protein